MTAPSANHSPAENLSPAKKNTPVATCVGKTRDLETLLPHRAPMILLSEVLDYDEEQASARIHISSNSAFFDEQLGGVPSWVGMEYMAQTIGLWAGHQQRSHNKPVKAGFLLGCRRYECNRAFFAADCTLTLSARQVYCDDSGIGVFDCTIESDGILATAQIKAFRPENPRDFVRPFSTTITSQPKTNTGIST